MKKLSLVLVLFFCALGTMLAQRTITGTISDDKGEALIGASVVVKGAEGVGTTSDIDGTYSLDVPAGSDVLIVSYTGYGTKEEKLGASNVVNISLTEGSVLGEVVITALGVQRDEKAVGYAVQQVGGDAIERSGSSTALQALRGKAAGVNVIQSSGAAGGGTRILIRGQTSITGNNQALIVIDGIRVDNSSFQTSGNTAGVANSNRLMDVNPADIASVNVLKGAAATALYGVDGANGVVVITTKRGKSGDGKKFTVDVGTSITTERVTRLPETQDIYTQGSRGNIQHPESGASSSWGPKLSEVSRDGDTDYAYDPNGRLVPGSGVSPYDNVGNFFQTGVTWNTNAAVSGGTDAASFRFSFSNMKQEGVIPNNTFNRATFKLAGDLKLTDKLKISSSVNYTNNTANRIQQGSNTSGLMLGLLRTPASFDNSGGFSDPVDNELAYRFADGTQRNYRGGGGYDNPFWTVNLTPRQDNLNRMFGNVKVDYSMHQWANFSVNLGADFYNDRRKQLFELNSRTAPSGRIIEDQFNNRIIDTYFSINGGDNLTDDLSLNYLLGANLNSSKLNNFFTTGDGLSFANFVDLSNVSSFASDDFNSNRQTAGFYGSLDLAYKNFLYLGITARKDYVSTLIVPGVGNFDQGNIGFIYPSVNLGFVFSEFLKNNDVFSFGKLRLSYAEVGGGAPSPYSTSTVFTGAAPGDGWSDGVSFPFKGATGFTLSNQLGNPLLKPERTKTVEAGLDLRFLNGRYGLDVTYYQNKSNDQILPVDLAGTTGYTSAVLNAGSLEGKGIEIVLKANPIKTKDFIWDVLINFDANETTVVELADGLETLQIGGFTGTGIYHVAGQPYGQIFGGAYATTGIGTAADDGVTIPAGDIVINDDIFSGEYGYQAVDPSLRVIGDPTPDITVGINNSFSYKDLTFSFLLDWKQGGQMWNGTEWALTFFGRAATTAENSISGAVRNDFVVYEGSLGPDGGTNSNVSIPYGQSYWNSSVGGFGSADQGFVQSTTWFRVREATLSYNLNPNWFKGTFLEGGSVYANGRNLFLWTPYQGVDPETSLTGTGNGQGFEYFNMPNTRSFTVGLNLKF